MIRWLNPFPWYDAWKSYAYASGAIQPAGAGAAGELLAEIRGKVVAVLSEEVIGCAKVLLRSLVRSAGFCHASGLAIYLLDNCVELLFWSERKAMECSLSEGAAGWFLPGLRPIHPTQAALVMPSVRIFSVANNNTGVQERAADSPQYCRYLTGRKQVVYVDLDLCSLE
jgi:hypothetical protein